MPHTSTACALLETSDEHTIQLRVKIAPSGVANTVRSAKLHGAKLAQPPSTARGLGYPSSSCTSFPSPADRRIDVLAQLGLICEAVTLSESDLAPSPNSNTGVSPTECQGTWAHLLVALKINQAPQQHEGLGRTKKIGCSNLVWVMLAVCICTQAGRGFACSVCIF